jgi:PD-(D/E)XK nuclease superfamily
MKWSVSASKMFQQCPKRWYYRTVFADSDSGNPERAEAYILKQLQSVHAWRGKVVDEVISSYVVPKVNKKERIVPEEVLARAGDVFDAQLAFARNREYRNGAKKTRFDYCALFELEYGDGLSDSVIQTARSEVVTSLNNLIASNVMKEISEEGSYLIAQRRLQFQFAGASVGCTPDLIVFFEEKPPLIVDWKVLAGYHREHWLQLGIYAFALSKAKRHRDFPQKWSQMIADPLNVRLLEFQLLRNRELPYVLTREDITEIEDYIFSSSTEMELVLNGSAKKPESLINSVPITRYPETCLRCSFKKICWRGNAE